MHVNYGQIGNNLFSSLLFASEENHATAGLVLRYPNSLKGGPGYQVYKIYI